MGISLSGGDYQYNRFDAYEASLEENRQAAMSAGESEGKKMMSGAGKPAKVTGGKTRVEMGKDGKPLFKEGKDCGCDDKKKKGKKGSRGYLRDDEEEKEEESPGEVGDGGGGAMGEGFMPLPKEKMERQSNKAYAKEVVAAQHGKEKEANKQMQRRIAMKDPSSRKNQLMNKEEYEVTKSDKKGNTQAYKNYKAGMKNKLTGKDLYKAGEGVKEELNSSENTETVMERQMARYSRALGMMGKHYSGPQLDEKKADKDYDGDGKVESGKEEYFGSKDKAIKKAMKKEEVTVEEGYKEMDPERAERQAKGKGRHEKAEQGRKIRLASAAHNDPKVGGMARAAVKDQEERNKAKGENKRGLEKAFKKDSKGHSSMEEEVSITKEMVVEYLVSEGYASNEVSAEILHTHVSDEFLAQIEESMISE